MAVVVGMALVMLAFIAVVVFVLAEMLRFCCL